MDSEYYKNPLHRYYDTYTYSYQGEEYLIRVHHNKLFLLFLSSQHPIIRDDLEVQSITYHTKEAKISGKRKRGAAKVNPDTQVMSIKTTNKNFNIPACITAQLLETNEKLIRNPGLVKDSDGFIGIFMVSLDKVKKVLSTLK